MPAYSPQPGTEWWIPFYSQDNWQRPTGPLCVGCHSVSSSIQTEDRERVKRGCEKSHGPGAAHAQGPSRANIVNPARLDSFAATDVCIQCHSHSRPARVPSSV